MFLLPLILGLAPVAGPAHLPTRASVVNESKPAAVATGAAVGAVFADTIHVRGLSSAAPTIDGNIEPGEWSASVAYDISDTAGRGGTPQPAGSCIAYFLHDSAFVYLAVDLPNRAVRADGDQFGPYVDEDWDGEWSADSSEGNYWVEYMESTDRVLYRALLDTVPHFWEMGATPDAQSASSLASGHLQFEAEIPIGPASWQYAIGPGDTVGFFQYAAFIAEDSAEYVGWWPQAVDSSQWWDPEYYGVMVFDSLVPGIKSRAPNRPCALYRSSPSLVRSRASVSYYVGRQAKVGLGVYDAAGSLVKTLARGPLSPGEHAAVWDRTDDSGRRVAAGAYFYHLVVDGQAVSSKAVVLE
jgi:hypothetical protein